MKPTSPQSKSFLVLISIALVGTGVMLIVSNMFTNPARVPKNQVESVDYSQIQPRTQQNTQVQQAVETPAVEVDTTAWKEYQDPEYDFSFKYNPDWKIVKKGLMKSGWYRLDIDPGTRFDNMRVFISDKDYFVMDGLPTKEEMVGQNKAMNVQGLLYGIKNRNFYLTFDMGASLSLQPQFQALVKSVRLTSQ